MPFFFFCSEEIAFYFKHELPNLGSSEEQLCLRSPPSSTACGVRYRAVAPIFSAYPGLHRYAEGGGTPGHICPFLCSFPGLSACTSGRRWMLNFPETRVEVLGCATETKPEQPAPHCSRGETWAKIHLIWLSDWQQDHAVCSTDPIIWKRRMLKKGTVIKTL